MLVLKVGFVTSVRRVYRVIMHRCLSCKHCISRACVSRDENACILSLRSGVHKSQVVIVTKFCTLFVGLQYGTLFMSPFCHLEFEVFLDFFKFVHPCLQAHLIHNSNDYCLYYFSTFWALLY